MDRLKDVLRSHVSWIGKPTSIELPLVPFQTAVYDAQLEKIGLLDPNFNALQQTKAEYRRVDGGTDRFVNSHKKAIKKAIEF